MHLMRLLLVLGRLFWYFLAMTNKPSFPILDVVATIIASAEYQAKLAKKINPKFSITHEKPSERLYIPTRRLKAFDSNATNDNVYLPSLTSYTKMTIGLDAKWLDDNTEVVTVTKKHRATAQAAMDTIKNKVMMMVLKGISINGFIGNLAKLLDKEEVLGRDIGLLTYVPKTARQYDESDKLDDKKTAFMNSKPVGVINDKVSVRVSIFNSRSMPHYESILYEGVDEDGNLITFFKNEASKDQFNCDYTYNITGKVKAVGSTPYSFGAIVNTLNYVKMVKQK